MSASVSEVSRPPVINRLFAGLLTGLLSVLFAATFGGLVFSGELSPYAGIGIGMAFFGAIVHACVIAAFSTYRGSIGGVPSESAILGVVVGGIASRPEFADHPETLLATTVVIIVSASLLTGGVCLSLGRARLGNIIRYIPYPVMGGFVAGVGWLLLSGGIELAIGHLPGDDADLQLFDPQRIWHWAPAFAAALLLVALQRRFVHFLGLPILLSTAGFLFYLSATVAGYSVEDLRAGGWLLGPFDQQYAWSPTLLVDTLSNARWAIVLESLPGIATYVVTIVIGLLLVGAAMEMITKRDVELNRELRAAGWSNLIAGFGGGFPGYHYIGCISLHHRMNAGHRTTGLFVGLVCLLALAAGLELLSFIPRLIAAILLFFMGMDLLWTWLVGSFKHLNRTDYLVVLAVFIFVVAVGFMEGVMVGLILGIALFAFNYSRIDVVKTELNAGILHSRAARTDSALAILQDTGSSVPVYQLEGFIFFGTVNRLLERIRERAARDDVALSSVILDFRNVRGLDSSAAMYFSRLPGLASRRGFDLAIAAVAPSLWTMLQREGVQQERRMKLLEPFTPAERRDETRRAEAARVFLFDTLDHALEWSENRLLDAANYDPMTATQQAPAGAIARLFEAEIYERFVTFGTNRVFEPGDSLTTQGEPFQYLYLIRSGTVNVTVDTSHGEKVRLKSMGSGSCVGEISMYLGGTATAHVVAQTRTEALAFSQSDLNRMRTEAPDVHAVLHEVLAHTLATRLADSSRLIDMLMY